MPVRLKVKRPESLLVLSKILPQHVPQSLGLLRAEINQLVIANGYLLRALAGSQAKYELEVPDAYAHLHAVGIGFAIIRGLGNVQLWLLCGWTHGFFRLLPLMPIGPAGSGSEKTTIFRPIREAFIRIRE
jgi:hypothetical protein